MYLRRVIPCLDTRDGRVVKGVQFQNLQDAGSPVELAAAYEAQGADELVVLDVSATPEEREHALETVMAVREVLSIPMTVGGGVRKSDHVTMLLEAGADKVSVNTAAVSTPSLLDEMAARFGRQCVVVAIDAARRADSVDSDNHDLSRWEVVTHSGGKRTGLDVVAWAREATERGAGEILLTSYDRDGTGRGYDTELIAAVSAAVSVPVIASGGAKSPEHMVAALSAGADAVLAASIFHDAEWTVDSIKDRLAAAGMAMRR